LPEQAVVITDHHLSGTGFADGLFELGIDSINVCPCCVGALTPTAHKIGALVKDRLQSN
jgi:hypothetical protein